MNTEMQLFNQIIYINNLINLHKQFGGIQGAGVPRATCPHAVRGVMPWPRSGQQLGHSQASGHLTSLCFPVHPLQAPEMKHLHNVH